MLANTAAAASGAAPAVPLPSVMLASRTPGRSLRSSTETEAKQLPNQNSPAGSDTAPGVSPPVTTSLNRELEEAADAIDPETLEAERFAVVVQSLVEQLPEIHPQRLLHQRTTDQPTNSSSSSFGAIEAAGNPTAVASAPPQGAPQTPAPNVGDSVWYAHPTEVWAEAVVEASTSVDGGSDLVLLDLRPSNADLALDLNGGDHNGTVRAAWGGTAPKGQLLPGVNRRGVTPDLCGLNHLHEAGILDNLHRRWLGEAAASGDGGFGSSVRSSSTSGGSATPAVRREPYTFVSVILAAVNPLCKQPNPPSPEEYADQPFSTETARPHPYALAELAFQQMCTAHKRSALVAGAFASIDRGDQSIVISGESGSGKTESAKIVLSYLTSRALAQSSDSSDEHSNGLESTPPCSSGAALSSPSRAVIVASPSSSGPERTPEKPPGRASPTPLASSSKASSGGSSSSSRRLDARIVASNPIFEAFGNAKTLRNGNSSRFGKFIKLLFQPPPLLRAPPSNNSSSSSGTGWSLVGAECETYLLEKSRVAAQGAGERNFHAFFQLLKLAEQAGPRGRLSFGLDVNPTVAKGSKPKTKKQSKAAPTTPVKGGLSAAEKLRQKGRSPIVESPPPAPQAIESEAPTAKSPFALLPDIRNPAAWSLLGSNGAAALKSANMCEAKVKPGAGVDDGVEATATQFALDALESPLLGTAGSSHGSKAVWRVLAAVLHLGELGRDDLIDSGQECDEFVDSTTSSDLTVAAETAVAAAVAVAAEPPSSKEDQPTPPVPALPPPPTSAQTWDDELLPCEAWPEGRLSTAKLAELAASGLQLTVVSATAAVTKDRASVVGQLRRLSLSSLSPNDLRRRALDHVQGLTFSSAKSLGQEALVEAVARHLDAKSLRGLHPKELKRRVLLAKDSDITLADLAALGPDELEAMLVRHVLKTGVVPGANDAYGMHHQLQDSASTPQRTPLKRRGSKAATPAQATVKPEQNDEEVSSASSELLVKPPAPVNWQRPPSQRHHLALTTRVGCRVAHAASLLGVPPDDLWNILHVRRVTTGGAASARKSGSGDKSGEAFSIPLDENEKKSARDAVCKALYQRTFQWLVSAINAALAPPLPSLEASVCNPTKTAGSNSGGHGDALPFIGVLDIFGFETFELNTFETLLINHANEVLQHCFNRHVFEAEQRLFESEGVLAAAGTEHATFPDNKLCVELVAGTSSGRSTSAGVLNGQTPILGLSNSNSASSGVASKLESLASGTSQSNKSGYAKLGLARTLDDVSRLPNASDEAFNAALNKAYGPSPAKSSAASASSQSSSSDKDSTSESGAAATDNTVGSGVVNPHWVEVPPHKKRWSFCVKHFAADVVYTLSPQNLWVQRNNDAVPDGLAAMLRRSNHAQKWMGTAQGKKCAAAKALNPAAAVSAAAAAAAAAQEATSSEVSAQDEAAVEELKKYVEDEDDDNDDNVDDNDATALSELLEEAAILAAASAVVRGIGSALPEDTQEIRLEAEKALVAASADGSFAAAAGTAPVPGRAKGSGHWTKPSVSAVFLSSMEALTQRLDATKCAFIRCIKPSLSLAPNCFDRPYVAAQLRYLGILQTCEVLRAGLPARVPYSALAPLFQQLTPATRLRFVEAAALASRQLKALRVALSTTISSSSEGETLEVPRSLLEQLRFEETPLGLFAACAVRSLGLRSDAYALGKSRLFFRAGEMGAIDHLLSLATKQQQQQSAAHGVEGDESRTPQGAGKVSQSDSPEHAGTSSSSASNGVSNRLALELSPDEDTSYASLDRSPDLPRSLFAPASLSSLSEQQQDLVSCALPPLLPPTSSTSSSSNGSAAAASDPAALEAMVCAALALRERGHGAITAVGDLWAAAAAALAQVSAQEAALHDAAQALAEASVEMVHAHAATSNAALLSEWAKRAHAVADSLEAATGNGHSSSYSGGGDDEEDDGSAALIAMAGVASREAAVVKAAAASCSEQGGKVKRALLTVRSQLEACEQLRVELQGVRQQVQQAMVAGSSHTASQDEDLSLSSASSTATTTTALPSTKLHREDDYDDGEEASRFDDSNFIASNHHDPTSGTSSSVGACLAEGFRHARQCNAEGASTCARSATQMLQHGLLCLRKHLDESAETVPRLQDLASQTNAFASHVRERFDAAKQALAKAEAAEGSSAGLAEAAQVR